MTKRTRTVCVVLWVAVAALITSIPGAAPAQAAANTVVMEWGFDETTGTTVAVDNSGNGITGTVGNLVRTGMAEGGVRFYRWLHTRPNTPPAQPERLVRSSDSRLNPGTADFAVTVRFRTTHSYGNMIQKGQATTAGGQFKWQIPSGKLQCLFRGRSPSGDILQRGVGSGDVRLNDGAWHVARCERTTTGVTLTVDGVLLARNNGSTGSISNTFPLTVAGKPDCDQIIVTCDYFAGDIDYVRIEKGGTVQPPPQDTTPPTTPGRPSGTSTSPGSIDLSWARSTDNVSSSLTYRVYRNGSLAGSTTSNSATVTFRDTGLAGGSTHTYTVEAVDGAGNVSARSPASVPITVQSGSPAIFTDGFSNGLGGWNTVTRVTIDPSIGSPAAPSARVAVSNQPAFLAKTLASSYSTLCLGARVNETVLGNNVLLRFKSTSNGPVARVFVDAGGYLRFRADVAGTQTDRLARLTTGWHAIEMCGSVGTSGRWDVYLDGTRILNQWQANTGTVPIGRVEIGDTAAKTWTANFDDVIVEPAFGAAG